MLASRDELTHGTPGRFLHRDAFCLGTLAQGILFAVRQPKGHGHGLMVSVRYRADLPIGSVDSGGLIGHYALVSRPGPVTVVAIDANNWRDASEVRVTPTQLPFVADYEPVALTILAKAYLSPEGHEWEPLAVVLESGATVGVLALDHSGESCQIRHFAIDARHQRRGLGRLGMAALIAHVKERRPFCQTVVVTFHPDNDAARKLYTGAGFMVTGVQQNGEPICTLVLAR